jgi:hypothetical protein
LPFLFTFEDAVYIILLLPFQPVELVHAYITPFTVKKSLKTVKPLSQAHDLKHVVSKNPMKKVNILVARNLH